MRRHAIPATLTSAGRVTEVFLPGDAEGLTGLARWREVYARFRRSHGRRTSLRLAVAAWRHGVVLSGSVSE